MLFICRYKASEGSSDQTLSDPLFDYLSMAGMVLSMCGLMFKVLDFAYYYYMYSVLVYLLGAPLPAHLVKLEFCKNLGKNLLFWKTWNRTGTINLPGKNLTFQAAFDRVFEEEEHGISPSLGNS